MRSDARKRLAERLAAEERTQVHDQDVNDGTMCLCGIPLADCDLAWENS
jgi:hypothetical protein